ncbi:MAG: hypothetical protein CO132_01630 [Candidatus Kerfeldbacteria bacterium CG_4_9_14_3_um_filter_45_8]|nr:MAG: hypothetical protein CO132_01630 [Candidatus Kerfeldbacteria bacterium CG_4_9_14_3_um_filter_45_8]
MEVNDEESLRRILSWRLHDWIVLGVAVLVNGLAWGIILWKLPPQEGTVFLHYNVYYGVDLTGAWVEVLMIPGSGLIILLFNTAVLWFGKKLDDTSRMLCLTTTAFIEVIILLASVFVVLLNS